MQQIKVIQTLNDRLVTRQTLSRSKEILLMVSWAPNIFLGANRMTHSCARICRESYNNQYVMLIQLRRLRRTRRVN